MPFKDKAAQKAWSEKYYSEHREEIITQKHQYYQENKEELNAKKREKYKDPEDKKVKQETARKSRLKNKERIQKDRRLPKRRFQVLVSAAQKRNLYCTLTLEQYIKLISLPCDYCDNQLGTTIDATGGGLDRLDNSKGYEIDNVVSCCFECNRIRSDVFTPEETKIIIKTVLEFRKQKSPLVVQPNNITS